MTGTTAAVIGMPPEKRPVETIATLPALVGIGLAAIGLMALFVRFCDRV